MLISEEELDETHKEEELARKLLNMQEKGDLKLYVLAQYRGGEKTAEVYASMIEEAEKLVVGEMDHPEFWEYEVLL